MDRSEFVRRLVLGEICDDYENVDQVILTAVSNTAAKCGLEVDRSDVVDALAGLIKDGLAKAYVLSPTKPYSTELQGMPPLEVVEENFATYFYATQPGIDRQLLNAAWWPLDDEGNLRPDWYLDFP